MKRPGGPQGRSVAAWVTYDLANTIFALGVIGLYFPDWLKSVGQKDSALALVEAAAGLLVIFLAPWAGARSDARGTRVPTLMVSTAIAVGATALLGWGSPALSLILLGVALIGFNVGSVVYDALLVDVSTPENRGWISGLGVGVGYFGSYIGLALGIITLDVLGWSYAATFRTLAAGFLIFALPAFVWINERPPLSNQERIGLGSVVSRIITSWRLATQYEGVTRFLLGRFLYTDAINTLIGGFLTIFVIEELGLDRRFVTGLLATAITGAIVGAIGAGRLINRFGPRLVLMSSLSVWLVAIAAGVGAAFTELTGMTWLVGPLGGLALGATWAADRVLMTTLSPPRHLGEFYGLYATVGRFATILGPLVWALIVDVLGLSRNIAMLSLMIFIASGLLVVRGVGDQDRTWAPEDSWGFSEIPDGPR